VAPYPVLQSGKDKQVNYNNSEKTTVKVVNESVTTITGQILENFAYRRMQIARLRIVIAPGGSTGWHFHPPDVKMVAEVKSGTLTMYYEPEPEEIKVLPEGTTFVEAIEQVHMGVNHGEVPVVLDVVVMHEADAPIAVSADEPPLAKF
jgi:quercetin dioxygenase-like cupin family protein